jgi:hypothetical protein
LERDDNNEKKIIKNLALILRLGPDPNFLFEKAGFNVGYLPSQLFFPVSETRGRNNWRKMTGAEK